VGRLEQLKLLLADREYPTAQELADDLGVSLRTLHRDLALLRDLGVPVLGIAGRGGGIELERGWSLGRVHLNEVEAMGLLLSLAIAAQVRSPLLIADIEGLERKIAQAFAPGQATRIRSLRRRVLLGDPASETVVAGHGRVNGPTARGLLGAFTSQRVARIRYAAQSGEVTDREIEPHYLLFASPVWYVLAWDRLREDARSFRADRLVDVVATPSTFRLRAPDGFLDNSALAVRPL
jgi:predicted DNA-binding transcriptional regulator YafY